MTSPAQPVPPADSHLALLYRLTQTFTASLDLDEVLNRVMDEVIATTRAERGFVMLRDASGQLAFRIARGLDQRTLEAPAFQISRGVVERVAREGQPMLTSDAQTDSRLNLRESVLFLGLRSILCVPLQIKGQVIGVIYVDNRLHAGLFTPADLDLLTSIAASAAIAIENARLYQVAVEKGRLERELQVAREVQSSLLPRELPQPPGWDFATCWHPAREVAGDYYDFIPLPAGRLGLVVGDVTDKGMPAALFMALTRSTVRASVSAAGSPAEGIAAANRLLCADSSNGMFVTLFYTLLDLASGELSYVNAGHNPPLLYRALTGELLPLPRTGLPLGIEPDVTYGQMALSLAAGDCLLLYTDGVTDARDAHGQEFGLERLRALMRAQAQAPAVDLLAALQSALLDFTGSAPSFDDWTALAARRLPAV